MGLEARHERLPKFELALRRRVAGHDELEAQDAARVKPRIDARKLQEAATSKPAPMSSAIAHANCTAASTWPSRELRTSVESCDTDVCPRVAVLREAQRRQHPEQHAGHDRQQGDECEHGRIDRDLIESRQH